MMATLLALTVLIGVPVTGFALPGWAFQDNRTLIWEPVADVAELTRSSEGMVLIPSGPIPTLLSPELVLNADDASYVRVRIQSPARVEGARLGWMTVDQSGAERYFGIDFVVPKELRGDFSRLVWIPVSRSSDWAGVIRRLGVAIPTEQPVTIESIAVMRRGQVASVQATWTWLNLDGMAERMAFPLWSLMSVGYVPLPDESLKGYPHVPSGGRTLTGYLNWVALAGMILWATSAWLGNRLRQIVRLGVWCLLGCFLLLSVAVARYLDWSAWSIERAVFGQKTAAQAYAYMDGLDLASLAEDVRRHVPSGSPLTICLPGRDWFSEVLFWRVRYQFYPVIMEPAGLYPFFEGRPRADNPTLFVLKSWGSRCDADQRRVMIDRPQYILYGSR